MDYDEAKKKEFCEHTHPMYGTVCIKKKGHDGLHLTHTEGESLKWGIPSQEEAYDVVRSKA